MDILLIDKSEVKTRLSLYDDNLGLIESESFADLYTLNFHLQTLAKKRRIEKGLLVIHDKDKNAVSLSLAREENSFFVSG
jgi:hypothetical protein